MSFDPDDELLQDFLLEGGEILEGLSEQLVELESDPNNADLLNAVFRGFHTIKGGAGFLALDQLVAVSHIAEDVFDKLRQQTLSLDPALMDVFLKVLDVLNIMFDTLRDGAQPEAAPDALLVTLRAYKDGTVSDPGAATQVPQPAVAEVETTRSARAAVPAVNPDTAEEVASESSPQKNADDEITEAEFDALLDEIHGAAAPGKQVGEAAQTSAASDDITEAEFDALLDELHGPGGPTASIANEAKPESAKQESDEISEEEFDALLDDLHGKGRAPSVGREEAGGTEAIGEQSSDSVAGEPALSGEASDALVQACESQSPESAQVAQATTGDPSASAASDASDSEEISEQEFDALLDELHGKGAPRGAVSESVENAIAEPSDTAPASETQAKQKPEASTAPAVAATVKAPEKSPDKSAKPPARDRKAPAGETTVRVDTGTLDRIMNMVGELVLIRNRLSNLEADIGNDDVTKTVAALDLVTADLQSAAMQTRMQPIKKVFGRFPRVVRDLARSLDKEINLEMQGEDTDLDKNLVEALADPLVHLVRNAVDHGIELPDEREAAGKPRVGTLRLAAAQEGDHILLTIADDGGGMDADVLRAKAVEKGLMDQAAAARLDDSDCFALIFGAGFSTKTEISDVSGRGVGMDVVKTRINQLNGVITIDSKLGEGTTIYIKVPLTLAIMPTLMIVLGKQIFALPLVSVREIIDYDFEESTNVDGQRTMVLRGRAVPLFSPSSWLVRESGVCGSGRGNVVVVSIGTQLIGLQVDQLLGREEVVIKPLGALLHGTRGLAGATITGEGRIALIIDLPDLVSTYGGRA